MNAFSALRSRLFSALCAVLVLGSGILVAFQPAAAAGYAANPQEWRLVWSDEFDAFNVSPYGAAPADPNKWSYDIGGNGWGNNELQYYTDRPKNVFQWNGGLLIKAQREDYGGRLYTSAKVKTQYKGDWRYGRVEVRAKLPFGQGIWPAIWMMPTDSVYGTWPYSGEIDIMENLGNDTNVVHGTAHWTDSYGVHQQSGASYRLPDGGSFALAPHTFALEWEPGVMRWYVDGNQYHTVYRSAPFDQRFYLIMNIAVGGNWPGSPDPTTVFPQRMEVDYVRVYQR